MRRKVALEGRLSGKQLLVGVGCLVQLGLLLRRAQRNFFCSFVSSFRFDYTL